MNGTYDSWKASAPDTGTQVDECPRDCEGCPTCQPEETHPGEVNVLSVLHDVFMHANPEVMRVVKELKERGKIGT